MRAPKRAVPAGVSGLLITTSFVALPGCEVDSWFDPSRTGYFETTPTSMPILRRIDVIERESTGWGPITEPTTEDLEPGQLEYRLSAGDQVRIEVYELVTAGQTDVSVRTVDPSGNVRLPTLGEIPAAGLTPSELQVEIEKQLKDLINDPIVAVVLERGQGFNFTIYGSIGNTGVYSLTKPDFRVMEAIALAGGTMNTTQRVYVIRSQPLEDKYKDSFGDRGARTPDGETPATPTDKPVDIDDLIRQLEQPEGQPAMDQPIMDDGVGEAEMGTPNPPAMGALGSAAQDAAAEPPPIDIDATNPTTPDAATPATPRSGGTGGAWRFDTESQTWVRSEAPPMPGEASTPESEPAPPRPTFAVRVIEVDYQALARGNKDYDIVIRPGDNIYVDPPLEGVVYVDGEISRPGVFQLPTVGELTLSRLVAAAGGFGALAIPDRCDLIRRVGPSREATVRVNLKAIRNRGEPDIFMRPDDHLIIGTNFFATPLAVIRNGFRMSYGFGFLLDRNFGNDVFGAPPENLSVNN
jgi:polysaccharide export outer membrane protein